MMSPTSRRSPGSDQYALRLARFTVVLLAALLFLTSAAAASEYRETTEFDDVAARVREYASKYTSQEVLLVVDIDNTLLAMDHSLGSDQWFEWQSFLLSHDSDSPYLVADDFARLLEIQGLLFSLGKMHPPQEDLPELISSIQQMGVRTLVLTSRGPEFRAATQRELSAAGYDFAASALPTTDISVCQFPPYDLENPTGAGLTDEDVRIFGLKQPRDVSYSGGVYMTSGQHKGAMLLTILAKSRRQYRAIVFADDHPRHVNRVYDALTRRGLEITAFQYKREEANVNRFRYSDKQDAVRRWEQLDETLESVFESN